MRRILALLILLLIGATAVRGAPQENLTVVSVSEILAKIQQGKPVEYDHILVNGDLNLSQLGLTNITSPMRINDSLIYGSIIFKNTSLDNSIDLSGSDISSCDFSGARFYNLTNFNQAWLGGYANFSEAKFNGPANFFETKFIFSNFSRATFSYYASFHWTEFMGPANFTDANFFVSDFSGATFSGKADFIRAMFGGIADFSGTMFNDNVNFSDVTFTSIARNADFNGASFKGYVTGWPLKNSSVDEVTYLALIKNLNDHGQFNDADSCYYDYRYRYMSSPLDYLSWISCGYGVRPELPLIWSVLLIVFFGIIYWGGDAVQRTIQQYYRITYASDYKKQAGFLPKRILANIARKIQGKSLKSSNLSFLDSLYFSSMIFFVSHPPTDWRPSNEWKWWKYLIMVEDIMGWLLLTLFVVTLTHVMVR
ncbi:MAG: pentapeptide repeat-containing protein [Syntrophorhabdus sp.]